MGFRRSVVYGLSTLRVVARYLLHRLRLAPFDAARAPSRRAAAGRDLSGGPAAFDPSPGQAGLNPSWGSGARASSAGGVVGVVGLELDGCGRRAPKDPEELEVVLAVGLADDRHGGAMMRQPGGRSRLGATVPEAERQAAAVGVQRSLEVVHEARRTAGFIVGVVIEDAQLVEVRAQLDDRAEGHEVPLARIHRAGAVGPVEGVRDGQASVARAGRSERVEGVHSRDTTLDSRTVKW